jgi:hypothetical protein
MADRKHKATGKSDTRRLEARLTVNMAISVRATKEGKKKGPKIPEIRFHVRLRCLL